MPDATDPTPSLFDRVACDVCGAEMPEAEGLLCDGNVNPPPWSGDDPLETCDAVLCGDCTRAEWFHVKGTGGASGWSRWDHCPVCRERPRWDGFTPAEARREILRLLAAGVPKPPDGSPALTVTGFS